MYGPRLAQDVLCRHICETPAPLPQKTIPNNFFDIHWEQCDNEHIWHAQVSILKIVENKKDAL